MPAKSRSSAAEALTVSLAVAIKRLHSRMREAALGSGAGMRLPIAQLAIIKHLRDGGPTTAAMLAVAEHVSHQAIAQNLTALKQAGLVRTAPDPGDGRKSLVHITASGNRLFDSAAASRDAWLAHAIEQNVPAGERATLERAIALLERLADAGRPRPSAGE